MDEVEMAIQLQAQLTESINHNILLGEQNEALRAKLDEPSIDTPCDTCKRFRGLLAWIRHHMFDRKWVNDPDNHNKQIDKAIIIDDVLGGGE